MGVKLIVLGVGNTLRTDDGIGIYLINELRNKFSDNPEIKIFEIGIEVWRIFPIIEEEKCENILIVDAIDLNFIPGFVYIAKNPDIFDFSLFSTHEKNYLGEIYLHEFKSKNIYIFGVQPYSTDWGYKLSDELKEKFDLIFEKLFKFCESIIKKEKENDLLGIETI